MCIILRDRGSNNNNIKKTLSRKLVTLGLSPVGIRKVQIFLLYHLAQIWDNKLLEKMIPKVSGHFHV